MKFCLLQRLASLKFRGHRENKPWPLCRLFPLFCFQTITRISARLGSDHCSFRGCFQQLPDRAKWWIISFISIGRLYGNQNWRCPRLLPWYSFGLLFIATGSQALIFGRNPFVCNSERVRLEGIHAQPLKIRQWKFHSQTNADNRKSAGKTICVQVVP